MGKYLDMADEALRLRRAALQERLESAKCAAEMLVDWSVIDDPERKKRIIGLLGEAKTTINVLTGKIRDIDAILK